MGEFLKRIREKTEEIVTPKRAERKKEGEKVEK